MHSGTITALAMMLLAAVQLSVEAYGCTWLYGQAVRYAAPAAVLATVMLTCTAAGFTGMPQSLALPPCETKLLNGLAASQLRVTPAPSIPTARRESPSPH